jgi:hypothetical protein
MALRVWLQDLGEGARPRTARKVGSGAEDQKCRRETKKYEEERRFELWKCQCRPGMDGWIERQGKTRQCSVCQLSRKEVGASCDSDSARWATVDRLTDGFCSTKIFLADGPDETPTVIHSHRAFSFRPQHELHGRDKSGQVRSTTYWS